MIGSETLAETIASATLIVNEWDDVDVAHSIIPNGWEYLGSGAYRHAFRGPDGFVYKVQVDPGDESNDESFEIGKMILDKLIDSDDFKIAKFDLFTDCNVFVQEYVDGEIIAADVASTVCSKICRFVNDFFLDIHRGNLRMVNGTPVIFDW